MKTILIASTLSFLVIFAGVYFYAQKLSARNAVNSVGGQLAAEDIDAAELTMAALEAEREAIARERERLFSLRESMSQQRQQLKAQLDQIQTAIGELREEQVRYGEARSKSAQKLAKMFDAMKPAAAAPVFGSLDRETALDILVRMKEKAAAKLLSEVDPRLAAELSTKLSLRGTR
ncbi:MAG TPA: hypothetical protein VKA86_02835 [Candidatus Krumholzibacteria bacterium]|nr:hypothetical protein [Candidatus Krumholzibacteria bacterium]